MDKLFSKSGILKFKACPVACKFTKRFSFAGKVVICPARSTFMNNPVHSAIFRSIHFPMFTHNGFSVYSNEVNGILNTESSVIICNEAVRLWLLWWYAGIKAIVVSFAQH